MGKSHAGLLKEGHAPSFVLSRWASYLYGIRAWSVRSARVTLGRVSLMMEVMYALCFFAHLDKVLISREAKLGDAVYAFASDLHEVHSDLWSDLVSAATDLQIHNVLLWLILGVPTFLCRFCWRIVSHTSHWVALLMLLSHLLTVVFMLDALWRTVHGTMKSFSTVQSAVARVQRAISKNTDSD